MDAEMETFKEDALSDTEEEADARYFSIVLE